MTHEVFISYSSKDKPIADAVCARLEGQGVRCWIAPRDILPGMEWGASIVEAIESARLMVLVLSANADASPQILREVERAVNKELRIVPLRIEDFTPGKNLEYFLGTPHWLDAISPPFEKHLDQIGRTVKLLLEQPVATPHQTPAPGPAAHAESAPKEESAAKPNTAMPTGVAKSQPSAVSSAPEPITATAESAQSDSRKKLTRIDPRQKKWLGFGVAATILITLIGVGWFLLSKGPVASALIGTWARTSPFGPDQMHLNLEIARDGSYRYRAKFVETGTTEIRGQKMFMRTSDGAKRFAGTVATGTTPPVVGNLVAAAPSAVWNVIARFSGTAPQFPAGNPFTLQQASNSQSALWKWDVKVGGILWHLSFRFSQDGTYKFIAEAADEGNFSARSGKWQAHSSLIDTSGSGTYSIVNSGTLVLSGSVRGVVTSENLTETIWVHPAALAALATPTPTLTPIVVPTPIEPTLTPINKRFMISQETPVYTAAQTSSAVLAHLRRGKWVQVRGLLGNWLQVQLPDGTVGFIPVSAVE